MTETIGNDLFARTMEFNYAQPEFLELMRKCWTPTPWMVNVYDSPHKDEHEGLRREIAEWCIEQFGPESWPIHDKPADWYRGSATVYGWTWYGFATEEMLNLFLERFPQEQEHDQ